MTPRPALVVALAAAIVGFGAAPSHAHSMRMTVSLRATDLTVKTAYSGGDHDGGTVTVTLTNGNKEVVATGKIGPDGRWTTPKPPAGKYVVVARDDFGHRAEQTMEVTDGGEAEPKEWKANEPPLSSGWGVVLGIGAIASGTLAAYWVLSRKKG